ncbi:MAG: NifU family protein [Archaeoglobaceae archaeon]|nr:NifU family protein [Archaeoglobaceae archaeon]MCX8152744.1 NifU family protein [Archaeoglobaceae archaeon]MDW8013451.1 NifU family protein [Archaeoglobaceae archaeon]
MKEKVKKIIDKEIKPALMRDGGSIELVDVDEKEGIVKVQLLGACGACPMSMITLTVFVERYLKAKIPEVKKVVLA